LSDFGWFESIDEMKNEGRDVDFGNEALKENLRIIVLKLENFPLTNKIQNFSACFEEALGLFAKGIGHFTNLI
jgi:hypothetical protein